jgi:Family of unknown function (DUF6200)
MSEPATIAERAADAAPLIVVDLGKQKRSRVKELRKGEGQLMKAIQAAIVELRVNGTVGANAQPVVVVVREREKPTRLLSDLLR